MSAVYEGETLPEGDVKVKTSNTGIFTEGKPEEVTVTADPTLPFDLGLSQLENTIKPIRCYVPHEVLARIDAGQESLLSEMRVVSVVFVRFDQLKVNKDVGADLRAVNSSLRAVQTALFRNEGTLRQFLVDDKGFLALGMFGTFVRHVDDPIRCIRAALQIKTSLQDLRQDVSIGVATGQVWIGTVGSTRRQEHMAVGDAVVTAARIMGHANGRLLCDVRTQDACRRHFIFEKASAFKASGVGMLQAFRVVVCNLHVRCCYHRAKRCTQIHLEVI